jgi:hypothetical protein
VEWWAKWQVHRAEIKKPLTRTQMETQLTKFAEWGAERSIKAMRHTISQGWQGIREDDSRPANGQPIDKVGEILKRTQGNANPK